MDVLDLRIRCETKMKELLDRHFGDLVKDAVVDKPEVLEERFSTELPLRIEEEFMAFLGDLKREILPDDPRTIDEIIDCPLKREMIRDEYELDVERAYEKAKAVTFWEKLTRSNHKDVSFFKGLVKQYTEDLLEHMTDDFLTLGETVRPGD